MFSSRCQALQRKIICDNATICYRLYGSSSTEGKLDYYDSLGIRSSSTQTEIKSAYYKLSMQYHPDKNQGCETAAKKFREISRAYEVLGNYRLRKLYDKGIIHTAGSQFAQPTAPVEEEDDPQTKFYKSRFRRTKVGDVSGRTPIYNFDEWSRAHYGKTFERRRSAKAKWEHDMAVERNIVASRQTEITLMLIISIMVAGFSLFASESFDTPKTFPAKQTEPPKLDLLVNNGDGETASIGGARKGI